jgi:hypothetical protein
MAEVVTPSFGGGFAEAAEACGGGEGQQVLFGKDGIHISLLSSAVLNIF